MTRTTTFANIGTDITGLKTSEEVLNAANLNYNVVKKPMYLKDSSGNFIDFPDKKFTVVEGTDKILGVVSSKYEVCQNRDAFSFIDYIGGDEVGFEYVKAGETHSGLVYIIAKIPNVTLLGDAITPYIIFQNSHDGLNSVKATICPLRIICQNQFNISFRQSTNTVRIIHSSQMDSRMLAAREMMRDVAEYMETFEDTAVELATKKVRYDDVIKMFNDVFKYDPIKMSERQKQNFDDARNDFLSCYNSDDNQNFIGTAWGIMNGAADYLTHHKSVRKTHPDSIFVNTTLLATTLGQIYKRLSV
jgi:phage/plasmid-like protein (TIGR03299 family)